MIGYAVVLAILTCGLIAVVVAADATTGSEPPLHTVPKDTHERLDATTSSMPETSRPSAHTRSGKVIRESDDSTTSHISRGP
jgi:hypothetical protein